jgi:hypothetical protein
MSESVIVALIAGLCAAIPSIYATYKQNKQNKRTNEKLDDNDLNNKAMQNSMMILLRSQIVSKCETYSKSGYLPDYARSCLTDLFAQYTALGGNHGVNVLVDETLKLPPIKEEKK